MITTQIVLQLISKILNCSEESLSSDSGLGKHFLWDSLGQVAIVSCLEKEFNIIVNEDNIEKLLTVTDITNYLNNKG